MKFVEVIDQYIKDEARCFVNGLPNDENTKGTILTRGDDYIEFELLKIEKKKDAGNEKTTREVKIITVKDIYDLSKGEEVKETSAIDKAVVDEGTGQEID